MSWCELEWAGVNGQMGGALRTRIANWAGQGGRGEERAALEVTMIGSSVHIHTEVVKLM